MEIFKNIPFFKMKDNNKILREGYEVTGLDKLRKRGRSDAQNLWDASDFSGVHILACKKEKKLLDLQILSQIGKPVKKFQWIPNTVMNNIVLVIFW